MVADLFTLGAYEVIDPVGLTENESKTLTITYDPQQRIKDVTVRCRSGDSSKMNVRYRRGFVCSQVLQG